MTEMVTRKRKRPSLTSALTQALKAGVVPTSATVALDGSVVISFGKREDTERKPENELDVWKAKHAN